MPILGIDPGIAITGYGLIDLDPAGNPIPVKYGVIDSTAEGNFQPFGFSL
jgi:Holliday junction resolvasome RuvABC endonuclease subunit